jgi:hypothetical protein
MIKEPVMATSSASKAPKKLDHLRVKTAKNGGFTVEHHYQNGMGAYHEPDIYAFGKGPEVTAHLNDHLGITENKAISGKPKGYKMKPGGKPDNEMADNEPSVSQGNRRTSGEQRGEA